MDRNPQKFVNINEAKDEDFVKANQRIYRSGRNTSNITLPIVR
jgi:predicted acyl esterase